MKAKLVIFEKEFEIVLKNGQTIRPLKKESQSAFISRVKKSVKKEFETDLDLSEMTLKKIKSQTSDALQKAVHPETGKAEGLFRKLVIEVLTIRGKLPKHLQETPKKETPKKETPKKETPKKETPKKETPKKESKELTGRQEALEAFKKSPEYKNAKKNVGKSCHYTSRTFPDTTRKGTVKGLLINRKANKAYYMILNTKTGKRESTTLDSVTF